MIHAIDTNASMRASGSLEKNV